MAARKTKAEKLIDARVNAAFRKVGNGIQIDIFDIGKILDAGRTAAPGVDDETLELILAGAFDALRKN